MNGWMKSCSLGTGCSRTGGSVPPPHPSFQILASPFSALHAFGLTVTLGQVSMVCRRVPMAGGGGVSEDRMVSALPLPAHVPPFTGPALRGAQKSLSGGMCKAQATPHSPHQQSTTETAVPLGDPWPLTVRQEAGPGGSPHPPPCFTDGGNSKHRANQAIFQTEGLSKPI